jgi:L-lactate utilization protein LutB
LNIIEYVVLKHRISTTIFSVALVLEEIAIDRDLEEEKLVEAQKLHLASLLLAR